MFGHISFVIRMVPKFNLTFAGLSLIEFEIRFRLYNYRCEGSICIEIIYDGRHPIKIYCNIW